MRKAPLAPGLDLSTGQFASPSSTLSQAQCEHMDMALTSQGLRGAAQFSQCAP